MAYVLNTTVTVEFILQPSATPPAQADYDMIVITPAGSYSYTDSALTTYTAPTATAQGKGTFDILVNELGKWEIKLVTGTGAIYQEISEIEIYIVSPIAPVLDAQFNRELLLTEAIFPPPGTIPPGYVNVAEVITTRDTDYAGGVSIRLKTGAGAQAVPADWVGYTGHADIAAAVVAAFSTPLDIGIHFPGLPAIPKYGDATVWDRNQNSVDEGGAPQKISFDPLDEYSGVGWQDYAWGIFNFMNSGTPEVTQILIFGGEAGYWALFNGDNPEWENLQWIAGDDVYIKLSNV